jgi:hypothetical protein
MNSANSQRKKSPSIPLFQRGKVQAPSFEKRRVGEDFISMFLPSIIPFPSGVRGSQ